MFDNPFSMVVAIVLIVSIAGVMRAKYKAERQETERTPDPEAHRLRDEIKALKERVAVLERLATDSTSALDREFEMLRKRDS
ncbi:Tfp pilus assembly protein PilO [Sphingomonas zeicaulis]|uniref:hypothetical protein n=1 Tax=Sphingomonas zeicaulis TaxID=1632740 RepID=UPI003D1FEE96